MKKYIYRFADGTISAVEVDEQTFAVLQEFDKAERNNDRAETRRHISFEENGLEISDTGTDIESIIEEAELISELKRAIALLTKEQRQLLNAVYYSGRRITDIAEKHGVDKSAISHRLETIYKKLKKIMKDTLNNEDSRGI